jgi:NitT/TauT family transport system substrate-binding protein
MLSRRIYSLPRALTVVLAAGALVVSGCSSSGATKNASDADTSAQVATSPPETSKGLTTVKVQALSIVDTSPLRIAIANGYFKKHGLNVEVSSSQGGATIIPAVVSGQIQFGHSNPISLLIAKEKGLDVKVVVNGNAASGNPDSLSSGIVVPADSNIHSVADMKGKTVVVNTLSNIGTASIRESVRKAGIDPDSIHFIELPLPDTIAALKQKRADAGWLVEPFLTMAKQQGMHVVLNNFAELQHGLTLGAYFTTTKYEQENPKIVSSFKAAMAEALSYAGSHPAEVRNILSSYMTLTPELTKSISLGLYGPDISKSSWELWNRLSVQDHIIKKPVDLSSILPND